jgi:uncharacterized membrane protein YtjA (UPF0391 family)
MLPISRELASTLLSSRVSHAEALTDAGPCDGSTSRLGETRMLSWALVFLIVAIIAAVLGFGGIAGAAAGLAKILFFVFLVLFVISFFVGRGRTVV